MLISLLLGIVSLEGFERLRLLFFSGKKECMSEEWDEIGGLKHLRH
jgi:hypothetical protein